jgi:polyisoprenoid-binding protein YceI
VSTASTSTVDIPGYVAGTWTVDPIHSDVSFVVRHLVVSKVRGFFREFEASFTTGATPEESSLTATVKTASIDTNQEQRNAHIRSADFLESEVYPVMTYVSTGVRRDGDEWVIDGDLTLKGVTKQVPLKLEINGFGPDGNGGTKAGFSAKGEINRLDFGVNFNPTMETGGLVVSDKVTILLEIEASLDAPAA